MERPRGKRQPTKKDPTAFRGGGRGRGLLGQLRPSGGADPTSPEVVARKQVQLLCPRFAGAKGVDCDMRDYRLAIIINAYRAIWIKSSASYKGFSYLAAASRNT